uniref:uncharacterized protein n=1 Tax=Myxine glutinosa TaxID=7769 RepID=UPI00358E39F6
MNEAVKAYQSAWAPDQPLVDACPLELDTDQELQRGQTHRETGSEDDKAGGDPEVVPEADVTAVKVLVQCEDYGQAIPLPSYKSHRPNVDYFNSDLHLQNFNLCNITNASNKILLYDERHAGKDGNAVCSLRWHAHTQLIKNLIKDGQQPPTMLVKVMDNCVGQNKSQVTQMFSALLSTLLYERVADFFLIPGHSHMKADQVVGNCKRLLLRQNIYLPQQVADAYNTIHSMNAEVITPASGVFMRWEAFLKKHMKPLPGGLTGSYCFEFHGGEVVYKHLVNSPDEESSNHMYFPNAHATRKALLHELLRLPASATIEEIASAKLRLPALECKPLSKSKVDSIVRKKPCIPEEYRSYYPGDEASEDANDRSEDEPPVKQCKVGSNKPVGHPNSRGRPKGDGDASQSILNFMLGKAPAPPPPPVEPEHPTALTINNGGTPTTISHLTDAGSTVDEAVLVGGRTSADTGLDLALTTTTITDQVTDHAYSRPTTSTTDEANSLLQE